jgi:hypothetical protein
MRFSDREPQTVRSRGGEDEVNMIEHQTIRSHLDTGLARLLRQ